MKRSDYKYNKIDNFLEQSVYEDLSRSIFQTYYKRPTLIINRDGSIVRDLSLGYDRIRSYNHDLNYFKGLLPDSAVTLIHKMREVVLKEGFANPQPREYTFFTNPESMSWHKDYNIENYPDNKRYITFLTISEGYDPNPARFMVAINSDGPGMWKIGFDERVQGNTFIGHLQIMGHEYEKNPLGKPFHVFSVQWYDVEP